MAKPSQPSEPSAALEADLRALQAPLPELRGTAELLADLDSRLVAERSSRTAWLRARPSWQRLSLATLALGIPALALHHHASGPTLRTLLLLVAMGLLMLAPLLPGLRPLSRRALGAGHLIAWLGGSLAAVLAIDVWAAHSAIVEGAQGSASACFGTGLLFALPLYVGLRALDRGDNPHAPLLALAAGVSSNLALNLHCVGLSVTHVVLGHFALVVASLAGHALVDRYAVRRGRT